MIDLCIVITAHSEGRLLRPTLRSISISAIHAQNMGHTLHAVLVLDRANDATRSEAERWTELAPGISLTKVETNLGDAGSARNAGLNFANSKYVAFCDGDDLVSENYLSSAIKSLSQTSDPVIFHAKYVLSFGARRNLWPIHSQREPGISYKDLIHANLWPSSSVSLRETYLNFPYKKMPPHEGYGPEDWLWNIETTSAGLRHETLENTVFFYRTRKHGGVNNQHASSILPQFDIKKLKEHFPATTQIEAIKKKEALSVNRALRIALTWALRISRPVIRMFPHDLRASISASVRARYRRFFKLPSLAWDLSPEINRQLMTASTIEPAISIAAAEFTKLPVWDPIDTRYAEILEFVLDQISTMKSATIWVPWLGVGGADLVALNYAIALSNSPAFANEISVIATYSAEKTLLESIPPSVNFVQIPETFRDLSPDTQRRLVAQLFIQLRPKIALSINCFDVTNALEDYGKQMAQGTEIFLSLFAFDHIGDGFPVNPITDDSQRNFLDDITGIITDNTVTLAKAEEILATPPGFLRVHYQPAMIQTPKLNIETVAFKDCNFSSEKPFKLLWPHRLDKEKRPRSVVDIAIRAKQLNLPIEISVYGQMVLSRHESSLLSDFTAAGVRYHGPYTGGLVKLPTDDFHAFLLTSESEGLPLAIVQSMLLGLPVITSDVGGVRDLVEDKRTGFLTKGPDDIDGYISAIKTLMTSRNTRQKIIKAAYGKASINHSWESFLQNSISEIQSLTDGNTERNNL